MLNSPFGDLLPLNLYFRTQVSLGVRSMGPGVSIYVTDLFETLLM